MKALLLAGAFALSGCGKGASKPSHDAGPRSARELFTGKAPTLPGPLAGKGFELTKEEARALGYLEGKDGWRPPGFGDEVRIEIRFDDARPGVRVVVVTLDPPPAELLDWLTQKWGEPRVVAADRERAYWWIDPVEGIRAKLTGDEVYFDRAMTLEQFVGDTRGRLGIERIPLIGATVDQVAAAYDQDLRTSVGLSLPDVDLGESTGVVLTIDDGVVTGYQVDVDLGSPGGVRAVHKGLLHSFGAPGSGHDDWARYPGPPQVDASPALTERMTIRVGAVSAPPGP